MDDLTLVIGSKNCSSWSLRAWLLLRQLDVPFREVVIALRRDDTAERILEWSPSGKVPVLIRGELHIWDSLAIAEYLAEDYPELWPEDAEARAVARSLSAEIHSGFADLRRFLPMDFTARFAPPGRLTTGTARDVQRVREIWRDCRDHFGDQGPFLFGRFSIADAMCAPICSRFTSYAVPLDDVLRNYVGFIMDLPAMREWGAAAAREMSGAPLAPTVRAAGQEPVRAPTAMPAAAGPVAAPSRPERPLPERPVPEQPTPEQPTPERQTVERAPFERAAPERPVGAEVSTEDALEAPAPDARPPEPAVPPAADPEPVAPVETGAPVEPVETAAVADEAPPDGEAPAPEDETNEPEEAEDEAAVEDAPGEIVEVPPTVIAPPPPPAPPEPRVHGPARAIPAPRTSPAPESGLRRIARAAPYTPHPDMRHPDRAAPARPPARPPAPPAAAAPTVRRQEAPDPAGDGVRAFPEFRFRSLFRPSAPQASPGPRGGDAPGADAPARSAPSLAGAVGRRPPGGGQEERGARETPARAPAEPKRADPTPPPERPQPPARPRGTFDIGTIKPIGDGIRRRR